MRKYLNIVLFSSLVLFINNLNADSLSEEAAKKGINETCGLYLNQIEESYGLNGLNITFVNPNNPSEYPSLHISSKKYNNGSSTFAATLVPDGEYCYLSTIVVTAIQNQSCNEIAELKLQEDPELQSSSYSENDYNILTPIDNSYQIILTASGEGSCTMSEIRMLWPGR
ncbi:hypothetical protein [Candidatus Thioglobus sp. NP1]|uniref:hypothetical protein n=1 Tax=Candidatus Thioglobus sp. NP1 TaxID=2508687 RepID=UPI000DEDDEC0|nr:hypothetical protein [Candidatus Thioglobus sp. NP1]AXE62430.1 hypothetical protein CRN91_07190 [Candidatus Thioglobus sp. NP1]